MSSHPTLQHLSPDPDRARALAWLILERHRELGTVNKLANLRRERAAKYRKAKSPDDSETPGSDAGNVAMLMLYSMAVHFGVVESGFSGLKVYASRRMIAESIGIQFRSTYQPTRDLVAVGAIRVLRGAGPYPDQFEIVVPPGAPLPDLVHEAPAAQSTALTETLVDSLLRTILHGGAFTEPQQDILLSMLIRIERLEAKKGGT